MCLASLASDPAAMKFWAYAAFLAFVGAKLLLLSVPPYLDVVGLDDGPPIKIGTGLSLGVVLGLLGGAVAASLLWPREDRAQPAKG